MKNADMIISVLHTIWKNKRLKSKAMKKLFLIGGTMRIGKTTGQNPKDITKEL